MKKLKYLYSLLACLFLLSCKKDVLDRPPLDRIIDSENGFWRNEDDVRLYANAYYPNYFNGFNTSFTVDYTPVRGYTFNDDLTGKNVQGNFESSVPTSRGSTSEAAAWMAANAPAAVALLANGADMLRGVPIVGRLVELMPPGEPAVERQPPSTSPRHHTNGVARTIPIDPDEVNDPDGGWVH